jgi:hypothetical protein
VYKFNPEVRQRGRNPSTDTHARTHALTHTRARAHARTHAHARTRTHAHARTHAHTRTNTHTHAHTRTTGTGANLSARSAAVCGGAVPCRAILRRPNQTSRESWQR